MRRRSFARAAASRAACRAIGCAMGARNPDGPKESQRRGKKASPRSTTCRMEMGRGKQRVSRRGAVVLEREELRFHTGRTGRHGQDFSLQIDYEEMRSIA